MEMRYERYVFRLSRRAVQLWKHTLDWTQTNTVMMFGRA